MSEPFSSPLPAGLSTTEFLARYWQKQPLLIRNALPGFRSPLAPDELAGLACETAIESRLVLEKDGERPWHVEYGPFEEQRFTQLPTSHWTLLVQSVDQHVPELASILDHFSFLPAWRLDDIMMSYAPVHGSVGPHVDNYDVFLLQGLGRRRWQIRRQPTDVNDCLPDTELHILREFNPEEEWILEPGDMLYLPPGVAHHGVALEDCITCSIGFRAPGHAELVADFADHLLAALDPQPRYSDADLTLQSHPGEVTLTSLQRIHHILRSYCDDQHRLQTWFGQLVTRPHHETTLQVDTPPLSREDLRLHLQQGGSLLRQDNARFAFIKTSELTYTLFAAGEIYPLPASLAFAAPLLCDRRIYPSTCLQPWLENDDFITLLLQLYQQQLLSFDNDNAD